jgi:hypothetical protein
MFIFILKKFLIKFLIYILDVAEEIFIFKFWNAPLRSASVYKIN